MLPTPNRKVAVLQQVKPTHEHEAMVHRWTDRSSGDPHTRLFRGIRATGVRVSLPRDPAVTRPVSRDGVPHHATLFKF